MASARYCDSCGTKIEAEEIEAGTALVYEESYYCGECKQDVLPLIGKQEKKQGGAKAANTAKTAAKPAKAPKAAAKASTTGAKAKAGASAGAGVRGGAGRKRESAGKAEAPAKAGAGASATRTRRRAKPTADDTADAGKRPVKRRARRAPAKEAAAEEADQPKAQRARKAPERGKRPAGKAPARARRSRGAGAGGDGDDAGAAATPKRRARAGAASRGDAPVKRRRRPRSESGDGEGDDAAGARRAARKPQKGGAPARRRRRSGSGSSEIEGAPEKKGLPLPLLIGGGAALVAILIIAIVMASGPEETTPADGGTQLASETQADKEAAAQALFEETKSELGDPPKDGYAAAIQRWSRMRADMTSAWAQKVDEEVARLQTAQKEAASTALDALAARAEALEQDGKLVEALDAWMSATQDLRASAAWAQRAEPAIKSLEKAVLAKLEAEPLLARADELAAKSDVERAIGVLEGYDMDTHRGTDWGGRVAARLRDLAAGGDRGAKEAALAEITAAERAEAQRIAQERADKKRKDLARVERDAWEGQGVDLFIWKLPEPTPKEAWVTEGKELVCKAPGSASGQFGAIAGVGKPTWGDYLVTFEYKITRGELSFGVRSNGSAFVKLEPDLKDDGSWHQLTVLVYGDGDDAFEEVLPNGSRRKLGFDAHDSWNGGVAFGVSPGGEVRLRNIKVKVIRDDR
jgi:hypothetical protein